jgi:hypothetical protein
MLQEIKPKEICHICLEDFKKSKPIKLCCDAYICKGCIHDLIENDHSVCPICKQDLVENKTLCEKIITHRIFIFTKYLCLYYTIAVSAVSLYILYETL